MRFLAPLDFQEVTDHYLGEMPEVSPEGLIMARALVRDGVLRQCAEGGGHHGPNGDLFPIPKNAVKASMIVQLVRLNKCHRFRPPRFSLPSVEDLAFLTQAHSMGLSRLSLRSRSLDHLNDPFPRELESLRLSAEPGAPLLACHIDLTNPFWSLTLPQPYKNSFRVRIDGKSYAFPCLPFGWRFSPVICQYVLAFVTGSVDTSGVLVLHYLDDFVVIGYGKAKVGSVSQRLCDALGKAGAVISTKSVLEPVPEIQWFGKWLVLSGDGAAVFSKGQGGATLLGLWIRAAALPLTRKHARCILGRFIWCLRPAVGFALFLSGWWAHCQWGPNWLQNCPLSLVQSLLHLPLAFL